MTLAYVLLVACIPLAFCLGFGLAAEAIGRKIEAGAVELEGKRYLCFPSALPPEKKKRKR